MAASAPGPGASLEQITTIWRGLEPRRRVVLLGAGAAAVAAVALLWAFGSQIEYRLLFSGLDPSDAAQVVEKLRAQDMKVKVEGDSVYVPASQVHETRLSLAASGLPRGGGSGFELFDRSQFGTSDFAERVTFLRALQGELARTIQSLEPIEKAAVHVVRPRPTVFRSERRPATASVLVHLRPGRTLSAAQVAGITHLVAGAVEGLDVAQVSVIDERGRMLTHRAEGELAGSEAHQEARERVERYLTEKAQSMLDRSVGLGKASVRVSAVLDRSRLEERRESYDPEGQVARKERVVSRQSSHATTQGPAGASSNVGSAGGGANKSSQGRGTTETEEESETTYEVGRKVSVTTREAGAVQRLTVALVLDESLAGKRAELERVVQQAVGFDPKRGDSIDVASVKLDATLDPAADAEVAKIEQRRFIISLMRHGGAALAAIVIAIVLGRMAMQAVPRRRAPLPMAAASAAASRVSAADRPGDVALVTGQRLDTQAEDEPPPPARDPVLVREELAAAARDKPRESADLVLQWLSQG